MLSAITRAVDETTILSTLSQRLRNLAYKMAEGNPSNDVEDYLQSALEEALMVIRRTGQTDIGYLYGVGRYAMYQYAKGNQHDSSLDAWLYDEESGKSRELPEPVRTRDEESYATRRQQSVLVKHLFSLVNRQERAVLRLYYGFREDGKLLNQSATLSRWGLTEEQYRRMRSNVVRKLRNQARVGIH